MHQAMSKELALLAGSGDLPFLGSLHTGQKVREQDQQVLIHELSELIAPKKTWGEDTYPLVMSTVCY